MMQLTETKTRLNPQASPDTNIVKEELPKLESRYFKIRGEWVQKWVVSPPPNA